MEPDVRDSVIDFIREVWELTGISRNRLIIWLNLPPSKYYEWKKRYGKDNRHNGWIPRDWWLMECEKQAIIDYYADHPFEGYRRLTYMMMDADVVAVSPSTVYRVLRKEGLLCRNTNRQSKKVPVLFSHFLHISIGISTFVILTLTALFITWLLFWTVIADMWYIGKSGNL